MKIHIRALLTVLIIGGFFLVFYQVYTSNSSPQNNELAKINSFELNAKVSFSSKTIHEKSIKAEDFKGKIVILNFWASWCSPCVEELPSLIKLIKEFDGKVQLIAISGDSNFEDVQVFMKSFPELKSNPNIHMIWHKDKELMKLFDVQRLPESYILDPHGQLVKRISGSIEWYNDGSKEFIKNILDKNL